VLALAGALAVPGSALAQPTSTSLDTGGGGARAAASLDVFTLAGAPEPNRITAYLDPTGRLVLSSPEGITAPAPAPGGQCRQDAPSQVSCDAGFVDVIAGDLAGGADAFTADPALTVAIGVDATGPMDRPLVGGPGRDRLIGGAGDDLVLGGLGPDFINGAGATDILRGEGGADVVKGGSAPDLLSGGGGADALSGGGGRDRCLGGAGVDTGRSCSEARSIP